MLIKADGRAHSLSQSQMEGIQTMGSQERPTVGGRSQSNTSNASGHHRPRSRGSTTSLRSVGVGAAFQPHTDSHLLAEQNAMFMQHGPSVGQSGYAPNSEEQLLMQHYQMQQQQQQQQSMDPHMAMQAHDMRPHSQAGFQEMSHYPMQYPNGMPQYAMHQHGLSQQHIQHMRQQSEVFEGSPAPEDSNTETGGAKRRKGTASSLANDQELRRLLSQYEDKSLKEVATEVQKNEGAGGKSEKAKQVFAMIWLKESCKRSSNSVRRDRVFSRYTERCGNERVPTLNPASFGKLVRIIFPNVQTRRLGVRGESKYHYVDLSLVSDDGDQYPSVYQAPAEEKQQQATEESTSQDHVRAASISQNTARPSMEIADFPAPNEDFIPAPVDKPVQTPQVKKEMSVNMDCHYLNTPVVRIPTTGMSQYLISALPSIRSNLPATLSAYLAMPSTTTHTLSSPSSQDSPIDLPDIHPYLAGTTYDVSIANSLSYLYRSYCIDVIDAFRKCKEKPFFNHHSAFNGKMTVPVAKLFALDRLAPWIQECDMRMYKQMIRFITPLALQVVPDPVWAVFNRVSTKLVSHLAAAFEEKCPTHVVVAKLVPAARFCHLLNKLRGANAAALHVAGMLGDDKMRTQMWLDLLSMVDPERVVDDSLPPPESLKFVEGMLKSDMKVLVSPVDNEEVRMNEANPNSVYAHFLINPVEAMGVMHDVSLGQPTGPLDQWIQWLERLPLAFDQHHPQCLINWQNGFWKSIMTQLGVGGAQSYQAWWYLEAFMSSMIGWMTQMEGLLMDESLQKEVEARELAKKNQGHERVSGNREPESSQGSMKRKRADEDVGGEERSQSNSRLEQENNDKGRLGLDGGMDSQDTNNDADLEDDDDDHDMEEIRRSGPLDLPSINTGSSPAKLQQHVHDDSGIDLGLDFDGEGSGHEDQLKRIKREWGILSDPADADGHVVVI